VADAAFGPLEMFTRYFREDLRGICKKYNKMGKAKESHVANIMKCFETMQGYE